MRIFKLFLFLLFFSLICSKKVLALDYGESCSDNYDCNSDFCTYSQRIDGHKYTFIDNTAVCSSVDSDEACYALGGSCTASFYKGEDNSGQSCTTSSGTNGVIVLNLCLSTINMRCCVPTTSCQGNYLKTTTYSSYNNGLTTTTNYCSNSCVQNGGTFLCYTAPPSVSSIIVKNSSGTIIAAESGNRNHICQPVFSDKRVTFEVTFTDPDGYSNMNYGSARLKLGSNIYSPSRWVSAYGNNLVVAFDISNGANNGLNLIEAYISDTSNASSGWVNQSRSFKFWNCQVPVSGTIYNGSGGGKSCEVGFGSLLANDINFTSLFFKQVNSSNGVDNNISGATYSSKTGSYFTWGDNITYSAQFNSDLHADTKTIDLKLNVGTSACSQEIGSFKIEPVVDPYATTPRLIANFLAIVDQDPWFQTVNGGVFGKSTITDYVPTTCALSVGCTSAISIGGLVAAPTINITAGVPYSTPNNWYIKSSAINKINFFEKYKKVSGVGTTLIEGNLTDSNIINNASGLLMVNGNVTISQDKETLPGDFLMIVASGDITINPSVNVFDGILVGNNINIIGIGATQLTVNGSLYATNKVNIVRNFSNTNANNTSPAVVVKYRPDFIFNMPSSMTKNVTEWKWGN